MADATPTRFYGHPVYPNDAKTMVEVKRKKPPSRLLKKYCTECQTKFGTCGPEDTLCPDCKS